MIERRCGPARPVREPAPSLRRRFVLWVQGWRKKQDAAAVARQRAVEIPAKLTAYCKEKAGQQAGNGECWTLADEACKACGLQHPGG